MGVETSRELGPFALPHAALSETYSFHSILASRLTFLFKEFSYDVEIFGRTQQIERF